MLWARTLNYPRLPAECHLTLQQCVAAIQGKLRCMSHVVFSLGSSWTSFLALLLFTTQSTFPLVSLPTEWLPGMEQNTVVSIPPCLSPRNVRPKSLDSPSKPLFLRKKSSRINPSPSLPGTPSFDNSYRSLYKRHFFLLCTLAILFVLCVLYLKYAVHLATTPGCEGLTGVELEQCKVVIMGIASSEEAINPRWHIQRYHRHHNRGKEKGVESAKSALRRHSVTSTFLVYLADNSVHLWQSVFKTGETSPYCRIL